MDELANAPELTAPEIEADETGPGIYVELGKLPPATLITESGLAGMLGKACRESIKRAIGRGELPPPIKLMGKNGWTVGRIVQHIEERLDAEGRKISRLRPGS